MAVPVGASETVEEFEREADECVCTLIPESFHSVGAWYEDFSQTPDQEVRDLLQRAAESIPRDTMESPRL